MPKIRVVLVLALLWLWMHAACTDDPTNVDRPPVVDRFYPEEQQLSVPVGDTLTFVIVALDPDRRSLRQQFSMGDSIVSTGTSWNYVVADTGYIRVRCTVSDGRYVSHIEWELDRYIPINHAPQIVGYLPVEEFPTMIIGRQMGFAIQATDDDEDPLQYYFDIDGNTVSNDANFLYTATEIGEKVVSGVVTDGEFFDSRQWHLTVTGVPDTIPPAEVVLTGTLTGDQPGELIVKWIAVGGDGMQNRASNYLVRTSPTPITDDVKWSRASERPGVPAPLDPGQPMEMVVAGLIPARFTHVAVRAVDDFGNLSPLGQSPGVYTRGMRMGGEVRDAVTDLPLQGITIDLGHFRTQTDSDGKFDFIEMPPMDEFLLVSDDLVWGSVGAYYDYKRVYTVVHDDYLVIHLLPNMALQSTEYPNFRVFFVVMTQISGLEFPSDQRRWELPIDLSAADYNNNGLDYAPTIERVANDLSPTIGLNVFNYIPTPPDVGVFCVYRDDIVYDNYRYTEWTPDWYPVKGRVEFRDLYQPAHLLTFEITIRHELGHALGLNHSIDIGHLMIGGVSPQVDNFTPDELAVIRARYHIHRGVHIPWYYQE